MTPPLEPDRVPRRSGASGPTLCIGLDIAWFGGSKADPDSQHDFLAWLHLVPGSPPLPGWSRVRLADRDPEARQILSVVGDLLGRHPASRVVFGIDAPLQESPGRNLPERAPLPKAGEVARRRGEDRFGEARRRIDEARGGAGGWHPNLQPGAPLAPRVRRFREGLEAMGFRAWTPSDAAHPRLLLECFPAEAIWCTRVSGGYPPEATPAGVKAYKSVRRRILTSGEVESLVGTVLRPLADATGLGGAWNEVVDATLAWMLRDASWRTADGGYRGGKLLDDAVDTLLCLATAASYAHDLAHVWHDPEAPDDGHICGPGPLARLEASARR